VIGSARQVMDNIAQENPMAPSHQDTPRWTITPQA